MSHSHYSSYSDNDHFPNQHDCAFIDPEYHVIDSE